MSYSSKRAKLSVKMADENHFRGHSDKDQQYLHAAAWCKQEGKGAKAAINTGTVSYTHLTLPTKA